MPSDPDRPARGRYVVQRWARDILQHWTRGKIARSGSPDDEDLMGRRPTCRVLRRRREVTQAERDEVDVYVCSVCGDVLDESPPF